MSVCVNTEKCIGCAACVQICHRSALELDYQGKAIMARPDDCDNCLDCANACPVRVISAW